MHPFLKIRPSPTQICKNNILENQITRNNHLIERQTDFISDLLFNVGLNDDSVEFFGG